MWGLLVLEQVFSKIPTGNSTDNNTSFYVGADLGVLYASDSSDSLNNINAQLLGGLNYFVTPDMSLLPKSQVAPVVCLQDQPLLLF